MGLFKSKEEKEALKEYRKKLIASGRIKFIMLTHVAGHPNLSANALVSVNQGLEKNTLTINDNLIHVTRIDWDQSGTRSVGKAAAGAIVGTVIAGPIGLLAGGALGAKKKNTSTAIISYQDPDGLYEGQIYLRADAKQFQKLVSMLQ